MGPPVSGAMKPPFASRTRRGTFIGLSTRRNIAARAELIRMDDHIVGLARSNRLIVIIILYQVDDVLNDSFVRHINVEYRHQILQLIQLPSRFQVHSSQVKQSEHLFHGGLPRVRDGERDQGASTRPVLRGQEQPPEESRVDGQQGRMGFQPVAGVQDEGHVGEDEVLLLLLQT